MKTLKLCFLTCLLVAMLTACSGDSPSNTAKEWLKASAGADGATALKLTCQQYKADVQMSGFLTAGLGMLVGVDTQSAEVDISDLAFQTTSESGDTATVHVEGEMIISLLGAAMPQQLNMDLDMVKEDGDWKVSGGG